VNPPEVITEGEVGDVDLILEYWDLIGEMAGEVTRELTEEEIRVLETFGRWLEQWREDVGGYFVEYE
jgi:predicted translin family RNA/ssDNA-binding protein